MSVQDDINPFSNKDSYFSGTVCILALVNLEATRRSSNRLDDSEFDLGTEEELAELGSEYSTSKSTGSGSYRAGKVRT